MSKNNDWNQSKYSLDKLTVSHRHGKTNSRRGGPGARLGGLDS